MKRTHLISLLGLGTVLIAPDLALSQTYTSPETREIAAGGELAVYTDTTIGAELTCVSGSAACKVDHFTQLDPGYEDFTVFVTSYQLQWEDGNPLTPPPSPDSLKNMGFEVTGVNYDDVTGQLDWTTEANFEGSSNTDMLYILEVTILLANTSSTKSFEFAQVSTTCSADVDDPLGTCSDSGLAFVPTGMTALAAPVRSVSMSSGTNSTEVEFLGFDTSTLTSVFGGAAVSVDTTCDLKDGFGATHGYSCNLSSVVVFADLANINAFTQNVESDSGINWIQSWPSSSPTSVEAVFTGLTQHVQAPEAISSGEFLITNGNCYGFLRKEFDSMGVETGRFADYSQHTLMGETFPTVWDFDAEITCARIEVN